MAVTLLAYEVADLCLGNPPLHSLSAAATVGDALAALKSSGENYISVWNCDHSSPSKRNNQVERCTCVGKVCMVDIICYLCRDDNLTSPAMALSSLVSVLLPKVKGLVRHIEPSSSLLDAVDMILEGAHNLVVPIKSNSKRNKLQKPSSTSPTITIHNGQQFCWLTQEDVIRFLLGSIGLFSPVSTLSIDALGIISHDFPFINYHSPASDAIGPISRAHLDQTSVAVVDEGGTLIGEISPSTLNNCDETVGPAIMALSAGDLMAYIDCGGPPEDMVRVVEERLRERNMDGLLEVLYNVSSGSGFGSEDEEVLSPTTTLGRAGRYSRFNSSSARMVRLAEAIVCHPWSSLVAVMIQAIAHRLNYVWVVEEDCSVVGIVTFANMLEVFRDNLEPMI